MRFTVAKQPSLLFVLLVLLSGMLLADDLPYIRYGYFTDVYSNISSLNGVPATEAFIGQATIAVSPANELYVVPSLPRCIHKVTPGGSLVAVAGCGNGSIRDGAQAADTDLWVDALTVDGDGNIFVIAGDWGHEHQVFRIDPAGILTVYAGSGEEGYSGDGGPAVEASLTRPRSLALDGAGNLYITDSGNDCVRKVTPAGVITTVAGTGVRGYSADGGLATQTDLVQPTFITVTPGGVIYFIEDRGAAHYIRKVGADGILTDIVANEVVATYEYGDGITSTHYLLAGGIALDAAGNLYVTEHGRDYSDDIFNEFHRVRKITPGGDTTFIAGAGLAGFSGDGGAATEARMATPGAIAVNAAGEVFVADYLTVRKISGGVITSVVGTVDGPALGDGNPVDQAHLYGGARGVAKAPDGSLYVSSLTRIRKISPDGIVSTVAGVGVPGFSGDGGPATAAHVYGPTAIAFGSDGSVYFADTENERVRKVAPDGTITTVAGNGGDDGGRFGVPATQTSFYGPQGLAVADDGSLYITIQDDSQILRVDPQGFVHRHAGDGNDGFKGDGGQAATAQLRYPRGLAFDADGNLYVADAWNHRVRKIARDGTITTVAGNGDDSSNGDNGPATAASLSVPYAVDFDAEGNMFIGEANGHRVRKVNPDGIISTIAGGSGYTSGEYVAATPGSIGLVEDLAVKGDAIYVAAAEEIKKLEPAQIFRNGVVNAASFAAPSSNDVAPGEIVTIFGIDIGPVNLANLEVENGHLKTLIGDTRVLFDGVPSPIIYSLNSQVSAVVPYSVAGKPEVTLQLEYKGVKTNIIKMPVRPAAPSLFTLNAMGFGQGAVLNQDYSVNGPSNPAAHGSAVMLYGTGEGQTTSNVDGKISVAPYPTPLLNPWVRVGGKYCTVLWVGVPPGMTAGVFQANVLIADDVPVGDAVPVEIIFGNYSSRSLAYPDKATIAVKSR